MQSKKLHDVEAKMFQLAEGAKRVDAKRRELVRHSEHQAVRVQALEKELDRQLGTSDELRRQVRAYDQRCMIRVFFCQVLGCGCLVWTLERQSVCTYGGTAAPYTYVSRSGHGSESWERVCRRAPTVAWSHSGAVQWLHFCCTSGLIVKGAV